MAGGSVLEQLAYVGEPWVDVATVVGHDRPVDVPQDGANTVTLEERSIDGGDRIEMKGRPQLAEQVPQTWDDLAQGGEMVGGHGD